LGKIFWADTETTGLDPKRNSLIELAGIIEIDGEIKEDIRLLFRPIGGRSINPEALKTNGRTLKELAGFPAPWEGVLNLKKTLGKYVDKYDPNDKFVVAGYNVGFDVGFIRETFLYCGDKYYGSWFFNTPLDVWTVVAFFVGFMKLRLPNYKLGTVCKHFGVKLKDAHTALADIYATRALCRRLLRIIEENDFADVFITTLATSGGYSKSKTEAICVSPE